MEKISAVVVTFNRKKLLVECLKGLENQTQKLSSVIIIDNASVDGTFNLLKEFGYIGEEVLYDKKKYKNKTILRRNGIEFVYFCMNKNEGGSGGFHEGMNEAYKNGNEWIWIMDDDVEPVESCLENLYEFKNQAICIHPVKLFENGDEQVWEGLFNPNDGRISFESSNISFEKGKEYCEVNYSCFEGALFNRKAIDLIGLPDKRFFIAYDDRIWGYLLSKYEKVIFTNKAVLKKKIDSRGKSASKFQLYFQLRNYFIIDNILSKKDGVSLYRKFSIRVLFIKEYLKLVLKFKFKLSRIVVLAFKEGRKRIFFEGSIFKNI